MMKRAASNLIKSERGATAIIVAMSLLLLMGFAAIAVDSGILFSDRRQQQSAADSGALAAIQFAQTGKPSSIGCTGTGATYAVCRGAEEAMAVVEGTLPGRYDQAAWLACTDPAKPAKFTRTHALTGPCISFTNTFQEARVKLPGTNVDTSFGRVVGPSTVPVGAFAEAGMDLNQSADILPFAIGPTGAGQSQSCLFAQATAQLNITPCEASSSGNFGKLDMSLYGNTTIGTSQICGNTSPQVKMAVNIGVGADHPLEKASKSPGTVNEVTNCPIITNPVDELPVQTGNAAQGISNGLFYGISPPTLEGRIMCKDGDANELGGKTSTGAGGQPACIPVWTAFPEAIDNTPLWAFISPGANAEAVGGACPSGGISNRAGMEACLAAWRAWPGTHNVSLFTDPLRTSPRFAAVPILASDPSGGSGNYPIVDFRPVYMETIYMKCNANSCDTVHSPGEPSAGACPAAVTPATSACGYGGNGNANSIEALTGFVMTEDMLPASIRENFPGELGTIIYNLSR